MSQWSFSILISFGAGFKETTISRIRKALLFVLLAAAIITGTIAFYPRFEPAAMIYDIHGIDVSHHQGQIDWPAVARDGVSFAFIKATEGGDHVDSRFEENWVSSAKAGILRGAYHFFTQCRPGTVQADNFIKVVPREAGALPPVIDAEHMGPCRSGPAVADVPGEIRIFLDRLEAHYGQRPIIYTTQEFHDAYLKPDFANERFWLRSLLTPPSFGQDAWTFWQYHNRGRRSGITGPVDLNVFRDEKAALHALASPEG